MIYNIQNKRLKNGPLDVNYDIIQDFSFDVGTENLVGVHYIACGLELNKAPSALLFYSEDYAYDDGILTFTVNTYTENFLNKVTKFATKAWLEIGIIGETKKEIILFDDIIVNPRVYIEGETPQPIPSSEYATRAWVTEFYQPLITEEHMLDGSLISGITPGEGVSSGWVEENFEEKITNDRKLSYSLLSGTPEIITSSWVDQNYQKIITSSRKLSYSLLSGTPTIPTVNNSQISLTINGVTSSFTLNQSTNKSIEFVVQGSGGEGVTSAYVIQKISDHNLAIDAHSSLFNAKQNVINNNNKLAYSLLSGTPNIPTKTSDLTNDSNFATSAYVTQKISDHNSAADAHSSLFNAKQNVINNSNKLAYSLLSGTPTIPTVNNATITFTQGGVTKGSFTLNQSTAKTIALDAGGGSTPGSGIITLTQGGAVKGTFNVNQSNNQTINLDAGGGGGGSMTYSQIYSSDTVLTAYHDCSYFWALKNQNATLYCENLQTANYDIPIDINLSGSTVTLSGITRNGLFADGCVNRCLITKRYDKTIIYIYAYEQGYDMTQGLVGTWTTLGTDSTTYAGAAQVYTETTAGHYDSADGTYYIEQAGTNWRLFSGGNEIAMGPASSDPMQGEYGTVAMAPLAGDSVLTVSLENIIVRS